MNLGDLQSQTAAWANRTDLTAVLPTFLDNAETRIYTGIEGKCAGLRLQSMVVTAAAQATPWTLPAPLLSIRCVAVDSGGRKRALDPFVEDLATPYLGVAGDAQGYLIRGNTLSLVGLGPALADITYFARPTTPTAPTDTNPVMDKYSGVYRWAMLAEAADYLEDANKAALYTGRFIEAMKSAQMDDDRLRNDGPLTIRTRGGVRV